MDYSVPCSIEVLGFVYESCQLRKLISLIRSVCLISSYVISIETKHESFNWRETNTAISNVYTNMSEESAL